MDYAKITLMLVLISAFLFVGDNCFIGCHSDLDLLAANDPLQRLIAINSTYSSNMTDIVDVGGGGSLIAGTTTLFESGISGTLEFGLWVFDVFTNPKNLLGGLGLPNEILFIFGAATASIGLFLLASWVRGVKL